MPKLSIIVPVYNEARFLEKVVGDLMAAPCPIEREWIFIDDKSTDETLALLKALRARYGFRLLEQECNQGKGAAVAWGIGQATGDFIMVQDADSEYDPADVPSLLAPLLEGRADVVYGSRFMNSANRLPRTSHYFANRLLTLLSNALSGLRLSDMETCYKIFRADLVRAMNLRSRRFGIEVELTAYVAKARARVQELPVSYQPRTRQQGKKIGWRDGVAALWHLIYFNCLVSAEEAFRDSSTR